MPTSTGWTGTKVNPPAVGTRYSKEGVVTAKSQVQDSEGDFGEALMVLEIGNQAPEILARTRDAVISIEDSLAMTARARDAAAKIFTLRAKMRLFKPVYRDDM